MINKLQIVLMLVAALFYSIHTLFQRSNWIFCFSIFCILVGKSLPKKNVPAKYFSLAQSKATQHNRFLSGIA